MNSVTERRLGLGGSFPGPFCLCANILARSKNAQLNGLLPQFATDTHYRSGPLAGGGACVPGATSDWPARCISFTNGGGGQPSPVTPGPSSAPDLQRCGSYDWSSAFPGSYFNHDCVWTLFQLCTICAPPEAQSAGGDFEADGARGDGKSQSDSQEKAEPWRRSHCGGDVALGHLPLLPSMGGVRAQFPGFRSIKCFLLHGYQPALLYQEEVSAVPSVRLNLRRCRRIWRQIHWAPSLLPPVVAVVGSSLINVPPLSI